MSVAVEQFEQMVQETYAWLVAHTLRRWCLVCEVETLQVTDERPEMRRYRCVVCGYQESIKQEAR